MGICGPDETRGCAHGGVSVVDAVFVKLPVAS